jgi:periplasmic protein TonB
VDQRDYQTRQSRPYRPPLGIPSAKDNQRLGIVVSVALHVIAALLLIVPFAQHVVTPILQGAGGPGPAGGGGGGRGGTGGAIQPSRNEQLRYIQVAPQPPQVAQPAVAPVSRPVVPPIVPPKPIETPPVAPRPDTAAAAKPEATPTVAAAAGSGGGTGSDGTTGSGPGSGGGVGTGVGTGRGSGVGPGTGGGTQTNYPPSPLEVYLPPIPVPDRLRGARVVAEFDVDETGRVVSFTFTETRDGGYNRRLREVLRTFRFRPGTRPDGTPIRMKAQIEYILSG